MSLEEELQEFIRNEIVLDPGAGEIGPNDPLLSSGLVDSMGLLQILDFVQQRYGTDLLSVGGPRDFESVASLAAALRRARGEGGRV
jgi:acyl carrier protein